MGTLIAAAVYILGSVAVLGVVPPAQLAQSTAPYADAASAMWGPWAAYLVAAGAAVSCFGALNGFTLLQGQVPMAAARDGLFPAAFGRMNAANVPAWGTIVSSVLVTILLALNYAGGQGLVAIFNFIILLATLTTLVPYAFCTMAEIVIFMTDRERFSGQRLTGALVIASLAFAYSLYTVYGSGAQTVLYGFLLLLLGLPVYVWLRKEQRDQGASPATAEAGAAAD
jgi:APA family basic amino acid/polyamine antiporter